MCIFQYCALKMIIRSFGILICFTFSFFHFQLCLAKDLSEQRPLLPWHLAIIVWDSNIQDVDLRDIKIDVVIPEQFPREHILFVAPFASKISNHLFYAGGSNKLWDVLEDGQITKSDKEGAILTKFDDKSEQSLRKAPSGYAFVGNHEGDHVSARTPFDFKPGCYTFRLVFHPSESKQSFWMEYSVKSIDSKQWRDLGAVRFIGKSKLGSPLGSFVELGDRDRTNTSISPSKRCFYLGNLMVNDRLLPLTRIYVQYPKDGAPSFADVSAIEGSKLQLDLKHNFEKSSPVVIVKINSDPIRRTKLIEQIYDGPKDR